MTLLEQISEQFEAAKKIYFAAKYNPKYSDCQVKCLEAEVNVWGQCLSMAQNKRGNFIG